MGDPRPFSRQSHVFTVYLWLEDIGEGQSEWRGRIEHLSTGEARYCREGTPVISWLLQMFASIDLKHEERGN